MKELKTIEKRRNYNTHVYKAVDFSNDNNTFNIKRRTRILCENKSIL